MEYCKRCRGIRLIVGVEKKSFLTKTPLEIDKQENVLKKYLCSETTN
jgi:hypothetical protein